MIHRRIVGNNRLEPILRIPPTYVLRGDQKLFPRQRPAAFPRVSSGVNRMMFSASAAERWLGKSIEVRFGFSLVGNLRKS